MGAASLCLVPGRDEYPVSVPGLAAVAVTGASRIRCRLGCVHPGVGSHDHRGAGGLIEVIGVPRSEGRTVAEVAGGEVLGIGAV